MALAWGAVTCTLEPSRAPTAGEPTLAPTARPTERLTFWVDAPVAGDPTPIRARRPGDGSRGIVEGILRFLDAVPRSVLFRDDIVVRTVPTPSSSPTPASTP